MENKYFGKLSDDKLELILWFAEKMEQRLLAFENFEAEEIHSPEDENKWVEYAEQTLSVMSAELNEYQSKMMDIKLKEGN